MSPKSAKHDDRNKVGESAKRVDESSTEEKNKADAASDLLVAAIGASAGGLEASTELVRHLDPDTASLT